MFLFYRLVFQTCHSLKATINLLINDDLKETAAKSLVHDQPIAPSLAYGITLNIKYFLCIKTNTS